MSYENFDAEAMARLSGDPVADLAAFIRRAFKAEAEVERLRTADHTDHMRESRIARARGLALAISECRDDARMDGIREGAAEIAELLEGQ